MSFWPLPRNIADALARGAELGTVFELGGGSGRLADRLSRIGHPPVIVDRRVPPSGTSYPFISAELTRLPLAVGAAGCLVLGNTLRHIPDSDRPRLSRELVRVLHVDGRVILLEDDPVARDEAEGNYRRTLAMLERLDPSRGPAMSRDGWVDVLAEFELAEDEAELENEETIEDPTLPLGWMAARVDAGSGGVTARELEALSDRVARHGMRYGRFWCAVLRRRTGEVEGTTRL